MAARRRTLAILARGWYRLDASRPSTACAGRSPFRFARRSGPRGGHGRRSTLRPGPTTERRGRPASLDFHLLPSGVAPDAQIALTLREVCGLTTDEIARAFLTPASTLAQRIVRAKAKIRDARIPYQVPSRADLPERLDAVLRVIYLVFNEGYAASSGASVTRHDLSAEAIRLGRLIVELLPEPEAVGLLALMLLQESRRAARTSPTGDIVLLEDQDRSLGTANRSRKDPRLGRSVGVTPPIGPYTVQAAIAAVHAEAPESVCDGLGGDCRPLRRVASPSDDSPVIELNRAVALAMRDGPAAGIGRHRRNRPGGGSLRDYRLVHAARAEVLPSAGDAPPRRWPPTNKALALTRLGAGAAVPRAPDR